MTKRFLKIRSLALAVVAGLCLPAAWGCDSPATVCFEAGRDGFALVRGGRPVVVLTDADADPAVQRVAASFADDLQRVSGSRPAQSHDAREVSGAAILIGVQGRSRLLDRLVSAGKLDLAGIAGRWEAFQVAVVKDPWPGLSSLLVVAGADRRGAVFGTYDLSEQMGVSAWYWFADVPVTRRRDVYVTAGRRQDQPGVRYRGFFINDEAPAFSGWSQKQFGGANSAAYEHVFELLLRLKGNYIWPAMWEPRAFHLDDPRNRELADGMGVVMGTSHHEPLTRAHAEWDRLPDDPSAGGEWNYVTNGENLRKFWRGALERMMAKGDGKGYENVLTLGMRGDGDEPMTQGTAIALLERIVSDQRALIEEVTGRPAAETPQMWALYKEVQDYYDQGMRVPEDVTLLFADDNWGQIRRLPTQDAGRKGGFGVYYHFDYVGAPRNYKWLNTSQVGKVWQQMDLAWRRGARDIWIVNVGDIKPMEFPLDFFMRQAWSPGAMTPEALADYPQDWARRQFGAELAPDVAALVSEYSRMAARRKPELVNENAFAVGARRGDVLVRGEFDRIVAEWRALVAKLDAVKPRVPVPMRDAFYQLVEFPILALSNLHEMYRAAAWNRRLAADDDPVANVFLAQAEAAFARDAQLTAGYHALNGGKWDRMMSQVHMGYVSWNDPPAQAPPRLVRVETPADGGAAITFVDPQPGRDLVSRPASSFDRSIPAGGMQWRSVTSLGHADVALVALPQGRPATTPDVAPRVEYDVELPAHAGLAIRLRLSPTLDTIGTSGVRIGVSLDDGPVATLVSDLEPAPGAADTPARRRWNDAVINNRVLLAAQMPAVAPGRHTVKVWRLDDNAVLENVEVELLRATP